MYQDSRPVKWVVRIWRVSREGWVRCIRFLQRYNFRGSCSEIESQLAAFAIEGAAVPLQHSKPIVGAFSHGTDDVWVSW